MRQTHLVLQRATRTLCGIRLRHDAALPFMHPKFLDSRRAAYAGLDLEFEACPSCEAQWLSVYRGVTPLS